MANVITKDDKNKKWVSYYLDVTECFQSYLGTIVKSARIFLGNISKSLSKDERCLAEYDIEVKVYEIEKLMKRCVFDLPSLKEVELEFTTGGVISIRDCHLSMHC